MARNNLLLRTFYRRAVLERLGFEPTSNAIKPVHVANGLARALTGLYGDVMPLHEVVRLKPVQSRPTPKAVVTAEDLKNDVAAFADCDEPTIGRIRGALNEILTVDHAVLGLPNFSSYTLSHGWFATNDSRDQGIGDLIWALLSADIGSPSSAQVALKSILASGPDGRLDDLTSIAMPLLLEPSHSWRDRTGQLPDSFKHLRDRRRPSHVMGWLRQGMDQLAARQAAAPQLLQLRQLVLLGVVGMHLYLVQWEAELSRDFRVPRDFCPILLDLTGDSRSRVADASRDAFQTALNYADSLGQWLVGQQLTEDWAGRDLDDGRTVPGVVKSYDDDQGTLIDHYGRLRDEGYSAREAAELTLFELGSAQFPARPGEFARYLALRSGFVGPRRGRGRKGYQISVELLTILTLSVVPEGEVWPVPRLLDQLWERYGIVVGGRDGDLEALAEVSIDRLTQDDLDANTERMIELLEEQGLARRYGDGVRQIGSF